MTQAAMTTSKLSLVAGAALMLAAFPAFAQTNTQPGDMNANPGMTPKSSMGTGTRASDHGQGTHQSMSPHHAMRGGRNDTSQNAAVDRLNDQSFQAAQQGQNFMPGSGSGSTMPASDSMGKGGMGQGNMGPGSMGPGGGMDQPNSGASSSGSGKM